eukprot:TRINITY_DN71_c0_g1_i1.p1 TRINITY_DN71_c0_g1~~TRINITY_DN71_c0_g1_i1.p1  ORF type:complete len:345 (+),score=90.91 TRINITY_DN71_c0_g1_i1:683-1717(+)
MKIYDIEVFDVTNVEENTYVYCENVKAELLETFLIKVRSSLIVKKITIFFKNWFIESSSRIKCSCKLAAIKIEFTPKEILGKFSSKTVMSGFNHDCSLDFTHVEDENEAKEILLLAQFSLNYFTHLTKFETLIPASPLQFYYLLSFLQNVDSLIELYLEDIFSTTALNFVFQKPFALPKNLKVLHLIDCDLSNCVIQTFIHCLPKLFTLNLTKCVGFDENIMEILETVNCKELFLDQSSVPSTFNFSHNNLKVLSLNKCCITHCNIFCKSLENLYLGNNNFESINSINLEVDYLIIFDVEHCGLDEKDLMDLLERVNCGKIYVRGNLNYRIDSLKTKFNGIEFI